MNDTRPSAQPEPFPALPAAAPLVSVPAPPASAVRNPSSGGAAPRRPRKSRNPRTPRAMEAPGFPWERTPLSNVTAAAIRAELARREQRIAELRDEYERIVTELERIEAELLDIGDG